MSASTEVHLAAPKYRPDVDGLRAVAVLSVVAFHAFPNGLRGGFAGVDVFFVISGYLISSIILGNLRANTFTFADFYARRIRRIFPALLLVLAASLAFGWVALLADEYQQLGKHVAGGAGFVANLVFWSEAGYFDASAARKPLLHLWSLGVEEQYYLVWPLLLWAVWRWRRGWMTGVLVAVGIASLAYNLFLVTRDPVATFYSPLTRFWELCAGGLIAWSGLQAGVPSTLGASRANALSWTGFALLVASLVTLDDTRAFPGAWALPPVIGTVLIVLAGPAAWLNRVVLSHRVAVGIGLISYPLYLWHWPLLSFLRILQGEAARGALRWLAVLSAIVLAWATYRFVERKVRFGGKQYATAGSFALMAVVLGLGLATFMTEGFPARPIVGANLAFPTAAFEYKSHWLGWTECSLVVAPDARNGGCEILHPERPPDIVVIGDSHAGHLGAGLHDVFASRPENVAVLLHAGCLPFYPQSGEGPTAFDCAGGLIAHALDYAIATPSVRTIVLAGYPAAWLHGGRFHEHPQLAQPERARRQALFEAGLRDTLDRLERSGKRVVFVVDVPELVRNPRDCVQRLAARPCEIDVPRRDYLDWNRDALAAVATARAAHPSVIFVDGAAALCDEQSCYGYRDGVLLYASRDHLTPAGSRKVVERLAEALGPAPSP